MKKEIKTLLKETLSKAKYYDTESEFLDDVENGYIADHVNEKGVMQDAENLRDDFINDLTCIEDLCDFEYELKHVYGFDLDDLDTDDLDELKDTLKTLEIVYIDATDTYYII